MGSGAFGQVRICAQRNVIAPKRAVKIAWKANDCNSNALISEYGILKNLDHPNIVKIYEMIESTKAMCLVTEYCNNGALIDIVSDNRRVPEITAKNLTKSILMAVNYCH